MKKLLLIVCFVTGLFSLNSTGQSDAIFTDITNNLDKLITDYLDASLLRHNFPDDPGFLQFLFKPKSVDSILFKATNERFNREIKLAKQDIGLNIRTGAIFNLKESLFEEDGVFYRNRYQVGLDWDFFKSGLIENRLKAKQLRAEGNAHRLAEYSKMKDQSYQYIFSQIIYTFNKLKIDIVRHRHQFLDEQLAIAYKMFYLKYIHWEEVLQILSKKAQSELFVNNYSTYVSDVLLPEGIKEVPIGPLPVFNIMFENILATGVDTLPAKLVSEQKINALQYQMNPLKDIGLSGFVRYNRYQQSELGESNRDFMSAGMQMEIPIPLGIKSRQKLRKAKETLISLEKQADYDKQYNEILNHFYEYEYTLKRFIEFYHQKQKAIYGIQRAMRKRDLLDPDYSPMIIVDKLDDVYSLDLELLDLQQILYLKALKIHSYLPDLDILSFIEIKDYNQIFAKYHTQKSLYVWSSTFRELSLNYLMEYFKYNSFQEVIISTNLEEALDQKLLTLDSLCLDADIHVSYLIGKNSWLKGSIDEAIAKINSLPFHSIHLDIEPHTFDDWSENEAMYQEKYLRLLRSIAQNHDVSVSIPVFYSESFLDGVYEIAERVYVMAYENKDVAYIKRKTAEEYQRGKNRTILSIRCKDFANRYELEQFINILRGELDISAIAVQDLKSMLDLEEKTIGLHEEYRF